jgi:hypothetical protein
MRSLTVLMRDHSIGTNSTHITTAMLLMPMAA